MLNYLKVGDIMKVTDITLMDQDYYEEDTILPYLLKNNIDNEKFFQSVFFDITIVDMDHPMDIVYRYFYEDIYLHNHDSNGPNSSFSIYVKDTETVHLRPSISELIGYINMTAPPLIINLIKKQGYSSIQEFIDVLKELLIVQSEKVPYYIEKFKECMGMNHFSTKTTYNFERMDMLRQINGEDVPLVDIEAVHGTTIEYFIKNDDTSVHVQCMVNVQTTEQVKEYILPILEDMDGEDSIINVYIDFDRGYFVELNIPEYFSHRYPILSKLIKSSYSKLYS